MTLALEIRDGVAELLLDHPPVNALDSAGWSKLADTLTSLGRGGEARAVVLGAKGRGFCAGVDIKELAADSSRITRVNRACFDAFAAVHDCPVPVIAACHGFVLGGGIGLVGSVDGHIDHPCVVGLDEGNAGLPGQSRCVVRGRHGLDFEP